MKLYAIRDRLIDYFLTPFPAPEDHLAMAAMAAHINNHGDTDAVQQAPHHFELWRLASVDDKTGKITAEQELLATCDALIRTRRKPTGDRSPEGTESAESQRPGQAVHTGEPAGQTRGVLAETPQAADRPGPGPHPGPH